MMKSIHWVWLILCLTLSYVHAQPHSQTIRGQVIDKESLLPLIGVNVALTTSDPIRGSSTDENGLYRLEEVPIGRHNLEFSYLGYEITQVPNIIVTTGKEVVLEIEMTEAVLKMDEIVVNAHSEKTQALNEMAIASARSFSVEETGRYASSLFDPARMAMNYAGVSTTGGTSDLFNEIIVRGNSPRGILWKLEGIEIPNPNHFGSLGNSGGGISMLSSSLLSTSDFYTGAFPAEFGNATSGVFDLNLRKGNNHQREYSFMFGILGTELAAEGPIGKPGGASYLMNFRYSSLALLQKIGLNPVGDILPEYGDLSFNIHLPFAHNQVNLFGLMGKNQAFFNPIADSLAWESGDDRYGFNERQTVATVGLSHRWLISDQSYLHTVIAGSLDQSDDDEYFLNARENYLKVKDFLYIFDNRIYRISSTYHHKINASHNLEVGMIGSRHHFDFKSQNYFPKTQTLITYLENKGVGNQIQAFAQWKWRPNDQLTIIPGIHFTHFSLTGQQSFEPRLAINWKVDDRTRVYLATGFHSRPEHPAFYLAESTQSEQKRTTPNIGLDYLKSVHLVAGYDFRLNTNLQFKIEAYYQHLKDVPVNADPQSMGTILNVLDIFDVLDGEPAINAGKGKNIGIDLTVEKSFSRNYYFLFTGSLFDSKSKAHNQPWFNTRFNSKYQGNLLAGKEFIIGKQKNKTLGLNVKAVINGGNRMTPILLEASKASGKGIYDHSRFLESSVGTYYRLDVGMSYKINRSRLTHSIMIDIQNVSNRLNPLDKYYSGFLGAIRTEYHTGLFPVLNYRLTF